MVFRSSIAANHAFHGFWQNPKTNYVDNEWGCRNSLVPLYANSKDCFFEGSEQHLRISSSNPEWQNPLHNFHLAPAYVDIAVSRNIGERCVEIPIMLHFALAMLIVTARRKWGTANKVRPLERWTKTTLHRCYKPSTQCFFLSHALNYRWKGAVDLPAQSHVS